MLKRRTREQPLNGASMRELAAPEDFKQFPNLWEWLTVRWWPEERKERITGTLLVFVEGGEVKICLNDRDVPLVAFVTCSEGRGPFEQAEEALTSNKTDWRAPRNPTGGGPRR